MSRRGSLTAPPQHPFITLFAFITQTLSSWANSATSLGRQRPTTCRSTGVPARWPPQRRHQVWPPQCRSHRKVPPADRTKLKMGTLSVSVITVVTSFGRWHVARLDTLGLLKGVSSSQQETIDESHLFFPQRADLTVATTVTARPRLGE